MPGISSEAEAALAFGHRCAIAYDGLARILLSARPELLCDTPCRTKSLSGLGVQPMSVEVLPQDSYNQTLVSHVHPPNWQNPTPQRRYNLVVIGAGTAGLVSAGGAAILGAKVALIERSLMGGDCLNYGCVPSKALIRAARAAANVRDAARFGVQVEGKVTVDFPAVMERMRRLRAQISPHDSATRFREMGVDVYLGQARLTSDHSVEVGGQSLQFSKAVIATGGRAAAPETAGLAEAGYLTNETIFSLTEMPSRLGVIGGGPIGCELAQSFARFGAEVTLISRRGLLPRDEPEAGELAAEALENDGVRLHLHTNLKAVELSETGKRLVLDSSESPVEVDQILVAAGRRPNVEGLDLETAGVQTNKRGVVTDHRLRSSNPRIYAAGDIAGRWQFTHVADAMARIALQNALLPWPLNRHSVERLVVPWCTYTSPEVARVGLSEQQAQEQGLKYQVFKQSLDDNDRAILDGETQGFAKVILKKGSDKLLGATVVAENAGDIISEITLAMVAGKGLGTVVKAIHSYPTQAEVVRAVADAHMQSKLTPLVLGVLKPWLRWTR